MISKIQMENVASYKAATNIETDRKVNLIYGLNGSGKSTISNFFYEPDASDYDKCSADVSEDEMVLVYNKRFIQDNFYEADSLKGIFSLSKKNKEIDDKIKVAEIELDKRESTVRLDESNLNTQESSISDRKTNAQELTWAIRTSHTGGDGLLEFCLDGFKRNKEKLLDHLVSLPLSEVKPNKEIQEIKRSISELKGEGAEFLKTLIPIEDESFNVEIHKIYNDIVAGKSDSLVSQLINELNNSDWVRSGLKYIRETKDTESTKCPFCQETTISSRLASDLEQYFDGAFNEALTKISNQLESYEEASSKLLKLEHYTQSSFAVDHLVDLTKLHGQLRNTLTHNIRGIKKKLDTPSSSVDLKNSEQARNDFNLCLKEINTAIENHNLKLENVEKELKDLKDVFWCLMRWEYDQTVNGWLSDRKKYDADLQINLDSIKKNKSRIAELRNNISNLQKTTVNIDAAVASINNGLAELGITEFFLEKHQDSLYKIVRAGVDSAEFSTLSEGEKMIISFLYYCELCRGKSSPTETKRKKIAVIDDPVSSLSHNYVFNIGQMLKSDFFNSSNFEQVFVLTHSLYFFYELTDTHHQRRRDSQRLFRLHKNDLGSQLTTLKYEEIQNDYHSYWYIVMDASQPPALIANSMRNIIEYFFNFVRKSDLNNVIQMPELKGNKYQAFCRYINRESHSLGQNIFDYKEFDYDSFREGLQLVFKVSGYPEHFEKMSSTFKVK